MSHRFYCHLTRCSWPDCRAELAYLSRRVEGRLFSMVVDAESLTEEETEEVAGWYTSWKTVTRRK